MKKRRFEKKTKILLGIIVVIALIPFFLIQRNLLTSAYVLDLYDTLQSAFYTPTVTEGSEETINELELKISDLSYRIGQLQYLKEENQELRDMLEFYDSINYVAVPALVLGEDEFLNNAIIINKGSVDGVVQGAPVVVGEGQIIGRVISVKHSRSTVLFLTDPQVQVTVARVGEKSPIGVTEGKFGLSIEVNLIPQSEQLSKGDLLVTSGIEELVPNGLIVGSVNRIISNENELFKMATVLPFTEIDSVRMVSVILEE